ncbi:tafazzin-like isoform X2 [Xenia sp. Carnegie-2017]|uniref:tafazzin-like isoform X2 n=1 Tax=Xenia sp. Carnegie-2017 TaxID=2897299 RepID=UPI001F04E492|nr:tafazzin-like isoform X2 [Xenia sp. Carnegie-2017]
MMDDIPSTALKWPFPKRLDGRLWRFSSAVIIAGTAIFTKIWLGWLNTKHVYNLEYLEETFARNKDTPLLTVTNHISCFDEPLIWGMLKWRYVLNANLVRWAIGADEMCFYTWLLSQFFSKGKVIPVIRGNGIYQKGMNFAIDRLNDGQWVHLFPEGRVNESGKMLRLKWGVGRLIVESSKMPIVIPFWQLGLNDVLPNKSPYIPKIGKHVTINIGKPMFFNDIMTEYQELKETAIGARVRVTNRIQERFKELKEETETLHKKHGQ